MIVRSICSMVACGGLWADLRDLDDHSTSRD